MSLSGSGEGLHTSAVIDHLGKVPQQPANAEPESEKPVFKLDNFKILQGFPGVPATEAFDALWPRPSSVFGLNTMCIIGSQEFGNFRGLHE
jgi:hypothetical protein